VTPHVSALLTVAGLALVVEALVPNLDHGTHLLVLLTAVVAVAGLLGPRPAVTGLASGGGLAVAASVVSIDGVLATPDPYVQLATYAAVGGAAIALAALAVRSRPPAAAVAPSPPAMRPQPSTLVEPLTARECEVLRLAATGIAVDEMATRLCVSPNTVKTHLTHVYAKLGVRGRTDAIRAAIHCGCLTVADICPHGPADWRAESPVPVTTARADTATM
jgi:DNA-binding CsgD family transcriptional regulator